MKKRKKRYREEGNVTYLAPRKKKFSQKFIIFLLIACLGGGGIIFSPVFSAKTIEVTKMEQYTENDICNMIGLQIGVNVFLYDKKKAVAILEENHYIESAEVYVELPSTVKVEIEERKVRGYVPYAGAYLYIDEYGRVLDVQETTKNTLPIVTGLQFEDFQLGELLETKNKESFDVVVKISQMIAKYELLDTIMELDVSDPKNITANINQMEIHFGSIDNCEQKMAYLSQIVGTIPEQDRGVLDLSDMSKPIVFQYLT